MVNEKVIEKIRKILELSKNNPSEEEAKSAALKAQKLLAQYDLTIEEIDTPADYELTEDTTLVGGTKKWRFMLAQVVAENFRCKLFTINNHVTFYGYATDVEVAKQTYEYLFNVAHKAGCRERDAVHRVLGTSAGVYNSYCLGFTDGVKSALEKQCTELMLVTPKEVTEGFENRVSGLKTRHNTISCRGDVSSMMMAKQKGFADGKSTMSAKSLEG